MRVLLLVISALSVQLAVTSAATVHDNHSNIDEDAAAAFDSSGGDGISIAQVAASVLQHEDGGFVSKPSVKKQGRECIVERALKLKLRSAPDVVELLSCDIGETCVEDASSSSGGRCAVVSADGAAAMEPRLEEECRKCEGTKACEGLSVDFIANNIGCGSCNGSIACKGLGDVTIGENSCNEFGSCYEAQGESNLKKCIDFVTLGITHVKHIKVVIKHKVTLVIIRVTQIIVVRKHKVTLGMIRVKEMKVVMKHEVTLVIIHVTEALVVMNHNVTLGITHVKIYAVVIYQKVTLVIIHVAEAMVVIKHKSSQTYSSFISTIRSNTEKECQYQYTAPITKVPSEMPSWAPSSTKPTEIPSSSPMPSISPTFAADVFEFVAHGYCLDARGSSYNFFQLNSAPDSTDYDAYCFNWCLQNDQTNFVGVQTWTSKGQAKCSCLFAKPGGLDGLDKESYNPPADYANDRYPGEGEIQDRTHNTHIYEVDYDFKCFRKRVGSHV
eukprot:scaffold73122_cov61-Cyclotella_meneghiniana.AAC.2